ncbi:hypothetical protein GCM10008927_01680 [Amylibacter ulvae]|uniref:Divergent polysaccharide deacetylase n=1 Tax=Paramylibacter ulvae TaxID=1651968 RepID=A0ABQ3CRW0_9RHOB|nr:divergent polysaccharide deacetylase family protein [Amylibacter ulvae]GHA41064.1 hypothetical protein GCM10008927_01680 [Amylibacter ulvae]
MTFVKAISGFIFGLLACGLLLFLVSVRSPIATSPPTANTEVAPATSDSAPSNATDAGNAESEVAPSTDTESPQIDDADGTTQPDDNDSRSNSEPVNTQISAAETTPALQPSMVGVSETVDAQEPATQVAEPATPTFTETLPSNEEFNEPETNDVAVNTTKPAVRIGTGIGEKSNSGLPTVGGETSENQLLFESETNKEATPVTPEETFGAFDSFSQEYISDDKPAIAIVIQDLGPDGLSRADLLKADFAASFAISGDMLDSKRAAAEYYGAGFEVLVENPMTSGAGVTDGNDTDTRTTVVRDYLSAVPTAVAFIDNPLGTLQKQHVAQKDVLNVLAESGHAIISYKRGLDPTPREAAKRAMRSGSVFRVLDANGEDADAIYNNLNRAVFKANQDGSAIVIASGTATTFDALQSWVQSGKASGVSIVPISAAIRKKR